MSFNFHFIGTAAKAVERGATSVARGDTKPGGGVFGFLGNVSQAENNVKQNLQQKTGGSNAPGDAIFNFIKSSTQEIAKAPETAVRSTAELEARTANKFGAHLPTDYSAPVSGIQKSLYGTDNLQTYQQRGEGVHQAHPNIPAPLAAAGIAGLDLTPGGGGKKSLADELVKSSTAKAALQALTKSGVDETIAKKIAPAVAQTKDPNIIKNIIDNAHKPPALPQPPIQDIKPPTPSGASEAAGQGMHDILNSGGTVDEALNHHMVTTGSNIGEAKSAFSKLLEDNSNLHRGSINAKLNPEYGKIKLPEVQAGDTHGAILNAKHIHDTVIRKGNVALGAVDKLSPNDLKLMDDLRTHNPAQLVEKADNPAAFREAADAVKSYNDFTHGAGSGLLGQEVPYRQNYGAPLLFDTSTKEASNALDIAKAKLKTRPGYGEQRYFKDYNEGASFGLNRRYENFSQDLAHDVSYRSSDLSQLTLAKGLEEAHPGQVKVGEIGSTPEGTYKQLLIPGGNKLSLPSELADEINKRASTTSATGALGKYDTINAGLKYIKLGGGSFHAVTEQANFIGQQLTSGKLFTNPSATGKSLKTLFSEKTFGKEIDNWEKNGTLDKARLSGLTSMPEQISADVALSKKKLELPVIKQFHDAIFKRQIPFMKLKTFEQKTEGLNIHNPEDAATMRKIAGELNYNYGGINRQIQGLTPKQFQLAARGILATDFTEGKIKTIIDAASKGGPDGKLAREMVAGKAVIIAGLATGGAVAGGEFSGKSPEEIAKGIISKVIDPSFDFKGYTVGLPSSHISEFTKPFKSLATNPQDRFSGLKDYATNRLAAVPSEVNQLINNRDFSKQPIYGADSKGRPISPLTTALNVGSGVVPIPVAQATNTAQGKQNIAAGIANTIGLHTHPQFDVSRFPVAQQTYLSNLHKSGADPKEIQSYTQLFGILHQNSGALKKSNEGIDKELAKAVNNNSDDLSKAQAIADKYNQTIAQGLQKWIKDNKVSSVSSQANDILTSNLIDLNDSSIKSRLQAIVNNPDKYGLKQ